MGKHACRERVVRVRGIRARTFVCFGWLFCPEQNFRLTEMFGSGGRQTTVGMELKSSFLGGNKDFSS